MFSMIICQSSTLLPFVPMLPFQVPFTWVREMSVVAVVGIVYFVEKDATWFSFCGVQDKTFVLFKLSFWLAYLD